MCMGSLLLLHANGAERKSLLAVGSAAQLLLFDLFNASHIKKGAYPEMGCAPFLYMNVD